MSPGEAGQGGVHLSLSEYTSRYCRLKLVEATIRGIEHDLKERQDRGASNIDPRISASRILASLLGVSHRTVNRWLGGGVQSCNVNAEKLIRVALEYAPDEARRLLEEDLEGHRLAFVELIGEE